MIVFCQQDSIILKKKQKHFYFIESKLGFR